MGTRQKGSDPFDIRVQVAGLADSSCFLMDIALHGKVCRSNRHNTCAHHFMHVFDAFYISLDGLNVDLQCMLMLCLCRSAVARHAVPDLPCFSSSSRVAFREALASIF
jgi:hypothetical protein